jgi:hypothetical protein
VGAKVGANVGAKLGAKNHDGKLSKGLKSASGSAGMSASTDTESDSSISNSNSSPPARYDSTRESRKSAHTRGFNRDRVHNREHTHNHNHNHSPHPRSHSPHHKLPRAYHGVYRGVNRRVNRTATISSDKDARYQMLLDERAKQIDVKTRKIENNNSWSSETEIITQELGEKAQGYVWMHNRNATYFSDWDTRYSNVGIILSILTGTSVFTTLNDCQELSLVTMATGIIIYLTAVLRAIHQNRKYPELAAAHRLAASKYSEVYHSVQKQLALYRRDRENAKDYINWITEKSDTLLLSSPDISDAIIDEYLTKFSDVKYMRPGDMKQIGIKKEGSGESTGAKSKVSALEVSALEVSALDVDDTSNASNASSQSAHSNPIIACANMCDSSYSEFSSEYESIDVEKAKPRRLMRSTTMLPIRTSSPNHTTTSIGLSGLDGLDRVGKVDKSNKVDKVDKKIQYEMARYMMR